MKGILFLCVANSSRSQMAERLARAAAPPGVEIFSAGSSPSGVNPHAAAVMEEIGLGIGDQRSQHVDEIPKERVDVVITLCAEEVCPVYLGHAERLHWPHEDPAAAAGSVEEVRASFRRVRDQLRGRIEDFLTP